MLQRLGNFLDDRHGNFGVMTAIVLAPLLVGAGLAVDVSHILRKQTELQHATDSAVLAVTREGKEISHRRAHQIATQFLGANSDMHIAHIAIARDNTQVDLAVRSNTRLAFGSIFGRPEWPIAANASADIAYAHYEIGLVLDTTGSMKGGKLQSMKDAVLGLIDTMSGAVDDEERLKFALVPFATFVNVGAHHGPSFDAKGKQVAGTGAPWLDLEGKSRIPQAELAPGASRFQIYNNLGQTWKGCIETRHAPGKDHDISDATPDPTKPETLFVPAFSIDEPDTGGYANSYLTSNARPNINTVREQKARFEKYGVKTDAAGVPLLGGLLTAAGDLLGPPPPRIPIDSRGGKGPGKGCDVQPITPLTSDYADLKRKVNAFVASGTTNVTEGVAWGLRVLSPGAPFSEGRPDDANNVEKIMIVLTDGANNFGTRGNDLRSDYSSYGYLVDGRLGISAGGSSATGNAMNNRTLAACTAAKESGVEIFTIRLEEPDVATGTTLRDCASGPDHYIDVPSRTQLDAAFQKIRERIVKLRIAS